MNLILNGDEKQFDQTRTVADLLDRLEVGQAKVAVMVNDEIIQRDERGDTELADGDRVEIIQMVGGG